MEEDSAGDVVRVRWLFVDKKGTVRGRRTWIADLGHTVKRFGFVKRTRGTRAIYLQL